ncbi:hypothetical protein BJV82DRAFT_584550 [Fennellomyces sp. T-0311]|nr:hypothetical protein BJV82DRAFT_584550 [Fennellomyces sp. T-0311]
MIVSTRQKDHDADIGKYGEKNKEWKKGVKKDEVERSKKEHEQGGNRGQDGEQDRKAEGEEDDKEKRRQEAAERRMKLARLREQQANLLKERKKHEARERFEKKRKASMDKHSPSKKQKLSSDIFDKLPLYTLSDVELAAHFGMKPNDVHGIYNPLGDGECGWRSVALVEYGKEDHYDAVKSAMTGVLVQNTKFYDEKLGIDVDNLTRVLKKTGRIDQGDWFDTVDCPQLVADLFSRPVVIYTSVFSTTFLPFSSTEERVVDQPPIVLWLRGGDHFNAIIVKEEAVARIKWPAIYPGYSCIIEKNGFSRKWLELYSSRCKSIFISLNYGYQEGLP